MQEQQFAAQLIEVEDRSMRQLKEEFQEKMLMVESQLARQKQQVRNGKTDHC